jgi:4-amino-4-deoxy-L-arabinose transferase-like glycosyltransferase
VQDPANIQLWRQEGGQPPLYYLIAAAVSFWIDTSDLSERLVRNPHAKIGIPMAPDNKNIVTHNPAGGFSFQGTELAVRVIRLLSTLMGAGTVLLTFLIAREVLPGLEFMHLAAAAVTAFNPMFLFVSGSVNNDNLTVLLCSLALWQMVRLLRIGATPWRVAGVGVVVGLAILTKVSALGLVPLVALVITWDAWRRRSLRAWLQHGFLAAALISVIAGWWYFRNLMLYDDPLGFSVWLSIAGARKRPPSATRLLAEFEGFRISYWGLFGVVNVLMHPLVYRFYDVLTMLSVGGLLISAGRWFTGRTRERRSHSLPLGTDPQPAQMAVLALWILILLAALVRWTRLTPASQGRLILPGIAAVSFWLVLGWANLSPRRWRRLALGIMAAALLVIAAWIPWAFIAPAYVAPATASTLPQTLQPLHITYGDRLELVGYRMPERQVYPGHTLAIELGWHAHMPMEKDYSIFVHLYGREGEFLGQADTYPGGGLLPTSHWSPGDRLLDTVYVPVKPDAQAPVVGRIAVGLYHVPEMTMLTAQDPHGAELGTSPTIGRFKVAAPQPSAYEIPQATDYQLGQELALVGYDLSAAPEQITLYWRAEESVSVDYTVFVHLLDSNGRQVAQSDGQPLAGEYPTSWWGAGEVIADRHFLPAEAIANQRPGTYALSVGLYDLDTGQRLPVSTGGSHRGDQILLGPVTVP